MGHAEDLRAAYGNSDYYMRPSIDSFAIASPVSPDGVAESLRGDRVWMTPEADKAAWAAMTEGMSPSERMELALQRASTLAALGQTGMIELPSTDSPSAA